MTSPRGLRRLDDIKGAIVEIRGLLADKTMHDVERDNVVRRAFERMLEIISEASRLIPENWKAEHSEIPWRNVADLGNHLRHAYRHTRLALLWEIYERDLAPLERAVDAMLAAHAPKDMP